jgi:hypothetical protein
MHEFYIEYNVIVKGQTVCHGNFTFVCDVDIITVSLIHKLKHDLWMDFNMDEVLKNSGVTPELIQFVLIHYCGRKS